jgi:MFS family permease
MNKEAGHDIMQQLGPLTDKQWEYILEAFHYPLIFFEPLAGMLFIICMPRKFMGRLMLVWGAVCMSQAAVQNFGGLFACRFLLGAAEAGFLPCILLHLSEFYPSELMTLRIAIVIALASLSGTLSGLLAFAISYLDGKQRLSGWRWLFILEGIPTVVCGICTWACLPDYPENTTMLTKEERDAVVANRPATQGSKDKNELDFKQLKQVLKDSTTYGFMLIFFCHALGAGGVFLVLPTVLLDLGITGSAISQLLTMPCYVTGGITLLIIALLIQKRKLHIWYTALALETCSICCYLALVFIKTPIAKYLVILLASTFATGVSPILISERLHAAKNVAYASLAIPLATAMWPFHGIIGPIIWLGGGYGPSYQIPFAISLCLLVTAALAMVVTMLMLRRNDSEAKEAAAQSREEERSSAEIEL